MAIPPLGKSGELPPGEFAATLKEIEKIFGCQNQTREKLMKGLQKAYRNFKKAGVQRIWVDGSFTTAKELPKDIDGCWEYESDVDLEKLDPVFISETRDEMKAKYGLDFFIAKWTETDSGLPFPKFFQRNRDGQERGIIFVEVK